MPSFKCQISDSSPTLPLKFMLGTLIHQCHTLRQIWEHLHSFLSNPPPMSLFLEERVGYPGLFNIYIKWMETKKHVTCRLGLSVTRNVFSEHGPWVMNFYTVRHCCLHIYIMGGSLKDERGKSWVKDIASLHPPTPGIPTRPSNQPVWCASEEPAPPALKFQ